MVAGSTGRRSAAAAISPNAKTSSSGATCDAGRLTSSGRASPPSPDLRCSATFELEIDRGVSRPPLARSTDTSRADAGMLGGWAQRGDLLSPIMAMETVLLMRAKDWESALALLGYEAPLRSSNGLIPRTRRPAPAVAAWSIRALIALAGASSQPFALPGLHACLSQEDPARGSRNHTPSPRRFISRYRRVG
jgi:hypothetical protein